MNPIIKITSTIEVELVDEFENEEQLLLAARRSVGETIDMNKGDISVEFSTEPEEYYQIFFNDKLVCTINKCEELVGTEEGEWESVHEYLYNLLRSNIMYDAVDRRHGVDYIKKGGK